jgi:hypothetical protein
MACCSNIDPSFAWMMCVSMQNNFTQLDKKIVRGNCLMRKPIVFIGHVIINIRMSKEGWDENM